jgi:hypothetical protein
MKALAGGFFVAPGGLSPDRLPQGIPGHPALNFRSTRLNVPFNGDPVFGAFGAKGARVPPVISQELRPVIIFSVPPLRLGTIVSISKGKDQK